MVHENKYNHVVDDEVGDESTYFGVEVIDQLDGLLQVSAMNGVPYSYSFFNSCQVCFLLYIGLGSKLLSSRGVSLRDQIVHDQLVYITACANGQWSPPG